MAALNGRMEFVFRVILRFITASRLESLLLEEKILILEV